MYNTRSSNNLHKMNLIKPSNVVVLLVAMYCASASAFNRTNINVVGAFNKAYINGINRHVELMYSFELPDDFNPLLTKLRVILRADQRTTNEYPLLATISQTREAISLRLPLDTKTSSSHSVHHLSRSLCIHSDTFDTDEHHFTIRIFTSSINLLKFTLEVVKKDTMKIELDVPVHINISPSTPDFFYFRFPETKASEEVHVKVKVTSTEKTCSVLSIQPALCPVPDHAENVRNAGSQSELSTGWEWETLSTKGAIVTSNKLISTPGFFIALLVTKDDTQCVQLMDISQGNYASLTKFTIIVERDQVIDIDNHFWIFPVSFPILLNFGILIVCGFVGICSQKFDQKVRNYNNSIAACSNSLVAYNPKDEGLDQTNDLLRNQPKARKVKESTLKDFHKLFDGEKPKYKISSTHYGKMVIVIAIFFSIPVFELTSYNLTVLHITGDNDICYFNSFCAHPLGYLKDFNHLWSNMGYVIFGFGFIYIAFLKNKLSPKDVNDDNDRAIPLETGIYNYAMGLALVMEGVMSAAYHLCPNRSNFQYDTCFMYIIAALCILKIFNFRHPRSLDPYGIFTILALFSLISAIGIMLERYQVNTLLYIFRICITIILIYVIGLFSIYTLYVGFPITDQKKLSSMKDVPKFLYFFPNLRKFKMFEILWHRIISVIFFVIANLGIAILIWFLDFATGLLRFLIINLIYYLLHYIIIKFFVHREFNNFSIGSMLPLIYFVLTIIFGMVSYSYFEIDLTEWRKSAAYSREGNDECTFLNFYDEHDIWHFLSSVAILFLFMTLLTLDDGVQDEDEEHLKLI